MWCLSVLIVLTSPAALAKTSCDAATIKAQLAPRFARDQAARNALTANPKDSSALKAALSVDADNTLWAKQVVRKCGWPKRSELGEDAAEKFWVLTQHADNDPAYQVEASQKLKIAVLAGEARPWNLASLVDRNRMLQKQPQVYGLQFRENAETKKIEFIPFEAPESLDERRKEIGLEPFYCWISQVARRTPNAQLVWPKGVPFQYAKCEAPASKK